MLCKTSELTGAALNWAVSVCEGKANDCEVHAGNIWYGRVISGFAQYRPSTDWSQGGPIIEREQLSVEPIYTSGGLDCWVAFGHNLRYTDAGDYIQGSDNRQYGPTPLVAAMRCYVLSKLGEEVEVPDALITK